MRDVVRRYGGLVGTLAVAGVVGGAAAPWMIGVRGLPGPLLLTGGAAGGGAVLGVLATLILLTGVAIVTCRLVNTAVGLFVLGCGLGVLAMRSGGAIDLAFGSVSPAAIGLETVLWGLLLAPVVAALFVLGGRLADVPDGAAGHAAGDAAGHAAGDAEGESAPLSSGYSRHALRGCLACVVAVPVVWVVLRNDLKGQALAAAVIGGLAAGTLGRIWAPRAQPVLLVTAALVALGIAQFMLARSVGGPLDAAFVRSTVPRLLLAAPIDLAAGVLAGVGMGLGWAKSFMRESKPEPKLDLRRTPAARLG